MTKPICCGVYKFHEVLPDPDPSDWFNDDDDVKVRCRLTKKIVAVACRPYQVKRETTPPPKDCPL